jgi:hypothetical protein
MVSFEHFARSIRLGATHRTEICVFTAYFDDSGKADQGPIVTVGGAVSTIEKWEQLSSEWDNLIAEYGLTRVHMKELLNTVKGGRAKSLMDALAGLVKKRTNKTISVSVLSRDWRKVNRVFKVQEELGSPFPMAGFSCVAFLNAWAKKNGARLEDIQVVFESGAEGSGFLTSLCRQEFGIDIAFGGKSIIPLQVADFVAWSNRRALVDVMDRDIYDKRQSLLILRKRSDASKYISREHLEQLCIQGKIPLRKEAV